MAAKKVPAARRPMGKIAELFRCFSLFGALFLLGSTISGIGLYSKYRHFAGMVHRQIDAYRHTRLIERHKILVVTPQRKNMKSTLPDPLVQFCKRIRKRIETVGSHLTELFKIDQIRVHDLWHFQHRLIRKILAHTVCVFVKLACNGPPLDLEGLIDL